MENFQLFFEIYKSFEISGVTFVKKTEKWPKSHEKWSICVPFFACDSENDPTSLPKSYFQQPDCMRSANEPVVQVQGGIYKIQQ